MNRQKLLNTLTLASTALADNDLVPIFKCFAFTGDDVIACNDTLTIIAPCKIEESFCLHGPTLLGLLQASAAEEVEFEIDGEDVVIATGKSLFQLPWFPFNDFPWQYPNDPPSAQISIHSKFIQGLEDCLWSSSKDTAQTALAGVHIKPAPKLGMSLYSCDGDAVTRCVVGGDLADDYDYLLPNAYCEAIVKLTKEMEDPKGTLTLRKEWVHLKLGDVDVYGRLLEVTNPLDHEDLIKKTLKMEPRYVKVPDGLDHALSRARVVGDRESAKTSLQVKGAKLFMVTKSSMGIVDDTLPYADKSFAVNANVSAALMQRCASLCSELSIMDNCCTFRNADQLFILLSNMG